MFRELTEIVTKILVDTADPETRNLMILVLIYIESSISARLSLKGLGHEIKFNYFDKNRKFTVYPFCQNILILSDSGVSILSKYFNSFS
jgi:hypothetical protein